MRACSGRLPAVETGPQSGPLPGDTARGEDGEREKCRKEQRQKDVEEGWIQGEQRAERRKVEGRMMCMV